MPPAEYMDYKEECFGHEDIILFIVLRITMGRVMALVTMGRGD